MDFLQMYQGMLEEEVRKAGMPAEVLEYYDFRSCIRYDDKKKLFVVIDKTYGQKGILRVTETGDFESAMEEAQVLGRLSHPDIPRVFYAREYEGRDYLVREYFDGLSLDQLVQKQGLMQRNQVFWVLGKLCPILTYLHLQNPPVVHRDIKPQNIILTPDGALKLIDFGIARSHLEEKENDTVIIGTRPYSPPEQHGYAQTTPRTDLYAMGIVALYLATGQTNRDNLKTRVTDPVLRHFIEKCSAFDPAARFASAGQATRYMQQQENPKRKLAFILPGIALGAAAVILGLWFAIPALQSPSPAIASSAVEGQPGVSGGSAGESARARGENFQRGYEGNLPGNLQQGGWAVQGPDAAYCVRPGSAGAGEEICRLAEDGTATALATLPGAEYLNYYDGYLYCAANGGIYRVDAESGDVTQLAAGQATSVGGLFVSDGQLYYQDSTDGLRLYGCDLDGGNVRRMNDIYSPGYLNVADGQMVYSNYDEDYRLYRCDLDGGNQTVLYEGEAHWESVLDGEIYFLDFTASAEMITMDMNGAVRSRLDVSASQFSVAPDGFYCVTNDGQSGLFHVTADGVTQTTLVDAGCESYQVLDGVVLYQKTGDSTLWMVDLASGETSRVS